MPILAAIAASTKNIEVGTGVIDLRYENPLYLAEEAAALDLIAEGRVALGVSRGSPEPAERGWEAFGYRGGQANGADMARQKFELFMAAVRGAGVARSAPLEEQYPALYKPGIPLPVFPQSPGLERRIWWGSGSHKTAEQAARDGVNLMSSTLVLESDGASFGEIQAEQIARYRAAWKEAGHGWTPRVSVSRTIFPLVAEEDRQLFGVRGEGGGSGRLPRRRHQNDLRPNVRRRARRARRTAQGRSRDRGGRHPAFDDSQPAGCGCQLQDSQELRRLRRARPRLDAGDGGHGGRRRGAFRRLRRGRPNRASQNCAAVGARGFWAGLTAGPRGCLQDPCAVSLWPASRQVRDGAAAGFQVDRRRCAGSEQGLLVHNSSWQIDSGLSVWSNVTQTTYSREEIR